MRGTKPIKQYYSKGLFKPGFSCTRLYGIWAGMKTRCYNPNDKKYPIYGGKGISMCDEWVKDFKAFGEWAICNGYDEHLTIDRIDTQKGYEPSNCRWVDMTVQQNNRTNNHRLIFNDENHTIMEWSKITGIKYTTILARLKKGWSAEQTLTMHTLSHSSAGKMGASKRWNEEE